MSIFVSYLFVSYLEAGKVAVCQPSRSQEDTMSLLDPMRMTSAPGALSRRDRRSFKRVELRLTGRFLTDHSEDHALILSPVPPESGQQIVCYFDDLGRVVAQVVRRTSDGFAVHFNTSTLKRDKLADRLTWLLNKDTLGLEEDRGATRYAATGQAIVILQDGSQLQCRLTDISLTGAAFEALGTPPYVGDRVHTGNLLAEVVRVAGKKFAVRYLRGAEAAE